MSTTRTPVAMTKADGRLRVLCDDGTVWSAYPENAAWKLVILPPIPGTRADREAKPEEASPPEVEFSKVGGALARAREKKEASPPPVRVTEAMLHEALKVYTYLRLDHYQALKIADHLNAALASQQGETFEGEVVYMSDAGYQGSIRFAGPSRHLRPGTRVLVTRKEEG